MLGRYRSQVKTWCCHQRERDRPLPPLARSTVKLWVLLSSFVSDTPPGRVSLTLCEQQVGSHSPPFCTPPPLSKLRKSPKLIRSLRRLWLGQGGGWHRMQLPTHTRLTRLGYTMHKHPHNQSYAGSSGQTLTTKVSMTPCNF